MITETSNNTFPQISAGTTLNNNNNSLKSSLKRPREDGAVDESETRVLEEHVLSEDNSNLLNSSEKSKKVKLINDVSGADAAVNSDKENGKVDETQYAGIAMSPQSKAAERERKRQEREEEKRKKEAAKAEKEAAKQAKQQQKEEERKRKEEERKRKEEEKRKKEEEKRIKEEEKKQREEEKRKRELEKEQERQRKEEERKQKEEEKRQKQQEKDKAKEEKRKKQEEEEEKKRKEEHKQKSLFGFITVKKAAKPEDTDWDKWYKPFQIPIGATVAPYIRVQALPTAEIDQQIAQGNTIQNLLAEFKKKEAQKRSLVSKKTKTQAPQEEERDVPIQPLPKRKMKLLLFHDNVRPAYFGTFYKVSKLIKARKPFAEDKEILDYEFDSDAEWEDVSEGEDVGKSDDEEEEEKEPNEPDNEEEEEFVVPDNYLSDDEGIKEEADLQSAATSDDPQAKEEKRKKLLELSKLKNPQAVSDVAKSIIGPVFDVTPNDTCYEKLKMYKAITFLPLPIDPSAEIHEPEALPNTASPRKRGRFPEEAIPQLLELVHGSSLPMDKLVAEMQTRFPAISELQIKKKIKEVAVKEKREGKSAWYVHQNLLNPQQSHGVVVPPPAPTTQVFALPPISSISAFPQYHQHAVQLMAPQMHNLLQPSVVSQQLVLPYVPLVSQAPVIAPASPAKQVHVLQIKRAPKPVPVSPAKPIQTFFSNSPSTPNDAPNLPQPTPMAVEPFRVLPQPLVSTLPVIDLNDASSDNVME